MFACRMLIGLGFGSRKESAVHHSGFMPQPGGNGVNKFFGLFPERRRSPTPLARTAVRATLRQGLGKSVRQRD